MDIKELEVELYAVEYAIENAMFRREREELEERRAEILGQMKELR